MATRVVVDELTKCTLNNIVKKLCELDVNISTDNAGVLAELVVMTANSVSKMNRIEGAADYARDLTYDLVGTENILTITHTGTTLLGTETIVETLTYVDPAANGSNITNIQYS